MEVGSVFASLCIWRWACPSVILGSAPVSSKSEKWTLGEIKVATKISILSHMKIFIYALRMVRGKSVDLKNVSSFIHKSKGSQIECLALHR